MPSIFNIKNIEHFTVFYQNDTPNGFGISFDMNAQEVYDKITAYIMRDLVGNNPAILKEHLENLVYKYRKSPEAAMISRKNVDNPMFFPASQKLLMDDEAFLPMLATHIYLWAINELPNDEYNGMTIMTTKDGVVEMQDVKLCLFNY